MGKKRLMTAFDEKDLKEFEPEAKVGLLATISPAGLPHITLITAMQAKTTGELIWGQFSEGLSKQNVQTNPKTGFLIMTLTRSLWRGTALWTRKETHGEDFMMFNNKPMFRYNAYFGIHTVHHMDLVRTYGRERLPMGKIILSSLLTMLAKPQAGSGKQEKILKPWALNLFNRLDTLKFLSYIDADGFPLIIPLIQCQAPDSTRLAYSPRAYAGELGDIRDGTTVAVFGLTLDMEDVLVRGVFKGYGKYRNMTLGVVDIDWVYNSMPPKHGQIYPEQEISPVVEF